MSSKPLRTLGLVASLSVYSASMADTIVNGTSTPPVVGTTAAPSSSICPNTTAALSAKDLSDHNLNLRTQAQMVMAGVTLNESDNLIAAYARLLATTPEKVATAVLGMNLTAQSALVTQREIRLALANSR